MLEKTNSILDDLASVIGYTATCSLVDLLGSNKRNLCVPTEATDSHFLAKIIGMPAFRALVSNYGGQLIPIPEGRWRDVDRMSRKVVMLYLAGKKTPEIATLTGLSERRVERIYKELEPTGLIPVIGVSLEVMLDALEEADLKFHRTRRYGSRSKIPTENAS